MMNTTLLGALLLGPLPLVAGATVSLLAAALGPNPVMGLRTGPLSSSPGAWRRTHYLLAAMLFVLAAACTAVGLTVGIDAEVVLLAAATPLLLLAAVMYGDRVAEIEQIKGPTVGAERPIPLPSLEGPRLLLVLLYSVMGLAALGYGCLVLLMDGLPAAAIVVAAVGATEAGVPLYLSLRRPWSLATPWLSIDMARYALAAVPIAASSVAGFTGLLVADHVEAGLAYLASAGLVLILLYPPLQRRLRRGLRPAPAPG